MIWNLLASTADKTRETGVGETALYALLGFIVVFVGIAFLILVVWSVGKVMSKMKGMNVSKNKKSETTEAVVQKTSVIEPSEEVDEETVAIITAALMAYYQTNKPKCEFTVKRIKRI